MRDALGKYAPHLLEHHERPARLGAAFTTLAIALIVLGASLFACAVKGVSG